MQCSVSEQHPQSSLLPPSLLPPPISLSLSLLIPLSVSPLQYLEQSLTASQVGLALTLYPRETPQQLRSQASATRT